jgi:hypothetical protein
VTAGTFELGDLGQSQHTRVFEYIDISTKYVQVDVSVKYKMINNYG